jgi:hypothetical protein
MGGGVGVGKWPNKQFLVTGDGSVVDVVGLLHALFGKIETV